MPTDPGDFDPNAKTFVSEPGDLLGHSVGSYRVTDYLGSGGMGRVYLAQHARIGLEVALKVLHLDLAHDPKLVRRFEDEARAATRAGHRNIVQVFDFGELPDGRAYFVMERLKGASLASALSRLGPFEPAHALAVGREVALALGAAHAAGVVHRDLKPDNVYLVQDGTGELSVKVLDFGIAKLQRDSRGGGVTEAGTVFGTPQYMAPEQAKGAREVDGRADLYALGIMLYEMLSGKVPFTGDPGEVLARQVLTEPTDLAELRQGLPPSVLLIVRRLLKKDPGERHGSAADLVADIDRSGLAPARTSTLQGFAASIKAAASAPNPAHGGKWTDVSGPTSAPGSISPEALSAHDGTPYPAPARSTHDAGSASIPLLPSSSYQVELSSPSLTSAAYDITPEVRDSPYGSMPTGKSLPEITGSWQERLSPPGKSSGSAPMLPPRPGPAGSTVTPVRPTAADGELVAVPATTPPRAKAKPRNILIGLAAGSIAGLALAVGLWFLATRPDETTTSDRGRPKATVKGGRSPAGPDDRPKAVSLAPVAILVASDPPGAEVTVEGEPASRGRAPIMIPVEKGAPVKVTLALAGHRAGAATLDPEVSTEVKVKLEAEPVPVTAAPATAAAATAKGKGTKRKADAPASAKSGSERVKRDATLKPKF